MSVVGRYCPSFGSSSPSGPLPSSPSSSPVGQPRPIVSLAERRGLPSSPARISGELSCPALTLPPDAPPLFNPLYIPALGLEPRAPPSHVVEEAPERKVACEGEEQLAQNSRAEPLTRLDRGDQRCSASAQESARHDNTNDNNDKTTLTAGGNEKGKRGCVVEHSHTSDQQKRAPNANREMEGTVDDGLDMPSLGDEEPQRRTVVVRQRVADAIALAARTKLEQGFNSCSVSMSTTALAASRPCDDEPTTEKVRRRNSSDFTVTATLVKDNDSTKPLRYSGQPTTFGDDLVGCTKEGHTDAHETQPVPLHVSFMSTARATVECGDANSLVDAVFHCAHGSLAAKPGSRNNESKHVAVDARGPTKRGVSIESSQQTLPVAGIVVGEQDRLRQEVGRGRANPLRSDDTHEEGEWVRSDFAMRANSGGNNRDKEGPAIIGGRALSFLSREAPTQDQECFLLPPRGPNTAAANLLSMFSIDSGGAAEGSAATRADDHDHTSSEDGDQVCVVRAMRCEAYTRGGNNSGEGRSESAAEEEGEVYSKRTTPLLGGGSGQHVPGVTLSLRMLGAAEKTASISSSTTSFLSPTAAAAVGTAKVPDDALAECGEAPLSLLPSPLPPFRVARVSLPLSLVEVVATGVELGPYDVTKTHRRRERNEALGSGAREGAAMLQTHPQANEHGEKKPNVEGNAGDVNFGTKPPDTNITFDNERLGGGDQITAFVVGDRTVAQKRLATPPAKLSAAKKESEGHVGVVAEENNSTDVRDILPHKGSSLAGSSDAFTFPFVPPFPPPPPQLPFQRVSPSPSLRLHYSSRQGLSPRLNHHHNYQQRQINTSVGHTNISSTPTEGPLIAHTAASYSFMSLVGGATHGGGGGSAHIGGACPNSERFFGVNSLVNSNYHHQHDHQQQFLMGRRPATPSFSVATTFTAVQTSRAPAGHLTAPTNGQAWSTSAISLSLAGGAGMVGGLYSSCAANDANDRQDTVSAISTLIPSRGNGAGTREPTRERMRQHLNGQQQEHVHMSVGSTSTGISGQLQSFGPGGATGGLLMRVLPVNSTDEAEGYDGRRRGRLGRRGVGRRCSNLSSTKKKRGATLPPTSYHRGGGMGVVERGGCDHSINNVPLLPNAQRFAALFEGLPSNMMSIDSVHGGNQTAMMPSPEQHEQRRRGKGACAHLSSNSKRRQKRATSGVGSKKVPHTGNQPITGDIENPTAVEIKEKEETKKEIHHEAEAGNGFSVIPKMFVTAPSRLDNDNANNHNVFDNTNSKHVVGIVGGPVALPAIHGEEKSPRVRGSGGYSETEVGAGEEEEACEEDEEDDEEVEEGGWCEEECEEDESNHSSDSTDFPLGPSRGRGKGSYTQRRQTTVFYGIGGPEPLPTINKNDDEEGASLHSDAVRGTTPTKPKASGLLLGQFPQPSQIHSLSMLSSASAFAREGLAGAPTPSPPKKGRAGGGTQDGGLDLRHLANIDCGECVPGVVRTDQRRRGRGRVIGGDKAPAAAKMRCLSDNERSTNTSDEENEGILCQVRSFGSDDAFSMVGVGSSDTHSVGNIRLTAPLEMMGSMKEDYRNKNIIGVTSKATRTNTCKNAVPHTAPDGFSPTDPHLKGIHLCLAEGSRAVASTSSAGDCLDLPRPLACRLSSEAPLPLLHRGGFLNQISVGDNVSLRMRASDGCSDMSERDVAVDPADFRMVFTHASGQEFVCVGVADGNQLSNGLQGLFSPCSDSNNKAIFLPPRLLQDDASK